MVRGSYSLQNMTPADEIEAYLTTVEWDAPQDYEKLILARLGVTIVVRAHQVHQWTYCPDKPLHSQMFEIIHI